LGARRVDRFLPAAPLAAALALAIWRAASASVTFDEGGSWLNLIRHPWRELLNYSQINHVLYSWILKGFTATAGASQILIRVPALCGTTLYLACVGWLCRRLFSGVAARTVVAAFLALNPLTAELFPLARGYSLALGFLSLALVMFVRDLDRHAAGEDTRQRWRGLLTASIALALSGLSHASYIPLGAGLALSYVALIFFLPAVDAIPSGRSVLASAAIALVPGGLLGLGLLSPYLEGLTARQSYTGYDNPFDSLRDMFNAEVYRAETAIYTSRDMMREPFVSVSDSPVQNAMVRLLPPLAGVATALLLLLVVAGWLWWLRSPSRDPRTTQERTAWLLALTLGWECLALTAGRVAHDVPFPVDRYGAFLVPLSALLWACVSFGRPWSRRAVIGVLATFLVVALTRWDPRFFRTWMFDAGARRFIAAMEVEHARSPPHPVYIGGGWIYAEAINFLAVTRHDTWLRPLENNGTPEPHDEFFIAHPRNMPAGGLPGYEPLVTDPVSGTILYRRAIGGGTLARSMNHSLQLIGQSVAPAAAPLKR
jgi:hypothetical protein